MTAVSVFPRGILGSLFISAVDEIVNDFASGSGSASAGVNYQNDGDTIGTRTSGANLTLTDWLTPKSAAPGGYEIRATQNSGDALTGASSALNTWLALTSGRLWEIEQVGNGTKDADLTIDFRLSGGNIIKSVNVQLGAEVEP